MINITRKKFKTIKEVRLFKNRTQSGIATAVGISESYYNLIENGKRRPPVDLAANIAKEIGITLDHFFLLYSFTKCQERQRVI